MKDRSIIARQVLYAALILLLIVPILQSKYDFVLQEPLKGEIAKPVRIDLSLETWFSGEYQEHEEKYLNENFGFRNTFVRLHNQIGFTLFNKAYANHVIIGKENCLLGDRYINAYYGIDFIGTDSIDHSTSRLKFINDTLNKLNKKLIIVFAPCKASFYPELIPEQYKRERGNTNYDYYLKKTKELGLNYIDFNQYFIEQKNKSPYPLYSKYGIHWSEYGMCVAADSLIRYMEQLNHIDMNNMYWNEIEKAQPRGADYDVGDGLNILFRLKSDELMAYPKTIVDEDSSKVKPSVLVISDSHYWGLLSYGITKSFSQTHFWFYNNTAHTVGPEVLNAKDLNLKNELEKYDIIILMSTEMALRDFGWGFIESAYDVYKGDYKTPIPFAVRLKEQEATIRGDKNWMDHIRIKAKERGYTVDSMVTLDAIWILEH